MKVMKMKRGSLWLLCLLLSGMAACQKVGQVNQLKPPLKASAVNGMSVERPYYSNYYDFWVDPAKVLVLSRDNYTSYTLPVYRDTETPGVLENLFLHPYNGGYLAFLLSYHLDNEDRNHLKNGEPIDGLLTKLSFHPLDSIDIDLSGTAINVPYVTSGGRFKAGEVIPYRGKCWRINHVSLYDDGSYELTLVLCETCQDCGGT